MDQAEPAQFRYSAFLSYSHQDAAFAARLQRRLESFRFPRPVADTVGTRLRPVFRDRSELTAGPDLDAVVCAALAASDWLIVVCSPNAARSDWVGREIAMFRAAKGQHRILTALVSGDERDAFHPELRGPSGEAEPLAADFRSGGDGKHHGLLKLVAAMAGLRLDELIRRDAQRRMRKVRAAAISGTIASAGVAGLGVAAINSSAATRAERALSADNVAYQLHVVRPAIQDVGRLELRAEQNQGISRLFPRCVNSETMNRRERLLCAEFLQAQGEDDIGRGKLNYAKAHFVRAYNITRNELRFCPKDSTCLFAHAQSEYWLGAVALEAGLQTIAELGFSRYAAMADKLYARDRTDLDALLEVAYSRSNFGTLRLQGNVDILSARGYFLEAQAGMEAVAQHRPKDSKLQREIADGYSWLAKTEQKAGNLDLAHAYRTRQDQIIKRLRDIDPANAKFKADELVALIGLARLSTQIGNTRRSQALWKNADILASDLSGDDPTNKSLAQQQKTIRDGMSTLPR